MKINLEAHLSSDNGNLNIKTTGIKTDNKIIYKENEKKVTIKLFKSKIEMNRVCTDYEINLVFEKNKKTMSTYKLLELNKEILLETKTSECMIEENKITINYELEGNKFNFYIEFGG